MLTKPVTTDYLAISKTLAEVLPKVKTNILYHQDNRLQKMGVADYYELQLGLPLNGALVDLCLYQDPKGGYILTDLGTLIFVNKIVEPLAKKKMIANGNAQTYENYDVFASGVLKQAWFTQFLKRFNLNLGHEIDIRTHFETLSDLSIALQSFLDFFNDLLSEEVQISAK